MSEERATHYTTREGGDWYSWHQRCYHSHHFPASIRFDSGWVFDCISNSWRKEGIYPPSPSPRRKPRKHLDQL